MSTPVIEALHDVHTATNDVLKGYREMAARAKPEIQPVIDRLIRLHEGHAAEQSAELNRVSEAGGDSSLQGTVNKVVVVLRDWLSDLDRDALPAVRDGEESLRKRYLTALEEARVTSHSSIGALLKAQMEAIDIEIARLPSA